MVVAVGCNICDATVGPFAEAMGNQVAPLIVPRKACRASGTPKCAGSKSVGDCGGTYGLCCTDKFSVGPCST